MSDGEATKDDIIYGLRASLSKLDGEIKVRRSNEYELRQEINKWRTLALLLADRLMQLGEGVEECE